MRGAQIELALRPPLEIEVSKDCRPLSKIDLRVA